MSSLVSAGRSLKCAITGPPVFRQYSPVVPEKSIAIAGLSARMRASDRTSACAGPRSCLISLQAASDSCGAAGGTGVAPVTRRAADATSRESPAAAGGRRTVKHDWKRMVGSSFDWNDSTPRAAAAGGIAKGGRQPRRDPDVLSQQPVARPLGYVHGPGGQRDQIAEDLPVADQDGAVLEEGQGGRLRHDTGEG